LNNFKRNHCKKKKLKLLLLFNNDNVNNVNKQKWCSDYQNFYSKQILFNTENNCSYDETKTAKTNKFKYLKVQFSLKNGRNQLQFLDQKRIFLFK